MGPSDDDLAPALMLLEARVDWQRDSSSEFWGPGGREGPAGRRTRLAGAGPDLAGLD